MIKKSYLFILLTLFVFSCATNQKEKESYGSLNESCYANLTCNDGLICKDRKCIKEVFTPECVTDNDCDNNQACNNEICVEKTNTCSPDCENWEKCNESTLLCELIENKCKDDGDCTQSEQVCDSNHDCSELQLTLTFDLGNLRLNQGESVKLKKSELIMQDDGNLVLYGENAVVLWYSSTSCADDKSCYFSFQNDGNLVIYENETAIWNSETSGMGVHHLTIDNVQMALYNAAGAVLWTSLSGTVFNFSSNTSVAAKFGVYEVILTGDGSVSNPYDTNCTVTFNPQSGNSKTVNAFYDGGNTWRARVYVSELGNWSWTSVSSDTSLNANGGDFVAADLGLKGMLKANSRNPRLWMTDNNETFINIADTAYTLFSSVNTKSEMLLGSPGSDNYTTESEFLNFVREDIALGITSLRALMFGRIMGDVNIPWEDYFEGKVNKNKPNLPNFQHTDNRMKTLLNKYPNMYIQLILFPGGYLGGSGCSYWASNMNLEQRTRLMKYMIARFAAFPNKFWSGSNDNYVGTNGTPDPDYSAYFFRRMMLYYIFIRLIKV